MPQPPDTRNPGKSYFPRTITCSTLYRMSPQALHLTPADILSQTQYLIFSPEHGLISEHCSEEEARSAFVNYLSEHEMGEFMPFLLKRSGEEWEIAEA